jgi:hypothetical protein
MENTMSFLNKLPILLLFFLATSCREDEALTKKILRINDEHKDWIVNDSTLLKFSVSDQNAITRQFKGSKTENEFTYGSSYIMGIKTQVTHREYYYQSFQSNYADNYSIYLYPGYNDNTNCGQIHFSFNHILFHYDFEFSQITQIEVNSNYISSIITTKGVESGSKILSTVEIIDSFAFNNHSYNKVIHFVLNDLNEHWNENTITEFFYAQKKGLLTYTMNNGLVFKRIE